MNGQFIRALHVIPSLSVKHGGPSYAVRAMARALAGADVDVAIATTDDDGNDARLKVPIGEAIKEEAATIYYFRRNILPYKVSFGLARWLKANVARFDVVHIHALFSFSSTVAAHTAYWQRVPYVIRPLGVLNRYGLKNRRALLKKISLPSFELRILRYSAAIHYTSEAEKLEAGTISNVIASQKSVVIPLPVEVSKGNPEYFRQRFPRIGRHKVILFLSRIDAKKGIELLLEAFADVRRQIPDVVLVVAGNGATDYLKKLNQRTKSLGLVDDVIWTDHLDDAMKWGAFAAADVFVLPSYSENFGIAAAEALMLGVPTIVTESVGISEDVRRFDAGLVIKNDSKELAAAIRSLLSEPNLALGLRTNATRLGAERYNSSAVGQQLRDLYDSVVKSKRE
jgi:glycosyltransferase involved in cell wall biosynthesis